MRIQPTRMTCTACGKVSDIELVVDAPFKLVLVSMREARCPHCGAGSRKLYLGGAYDDAPSLMDPIKARASWWLERGDVGSSSATMFAAFSGTPSPLPLGVPLDRVDFKRCKDLLDLIPEWRPQLDKVTTMFPWFAPFIDRWEEFEKLYAEEQPAGTCPKLYELLQIAAKEADTIRSKQREKGTPTP